jgi:hypothetical protein
LLRSLRHAVRTTLADCPFFGRRQSAKVVSTKIGVPLMARLNAVQAFPMTLTLINRGRFAAFVAFGSWPFVACWFVLNSTMGQNRRLWMRLSARNRVKLPLDRVNLPLKTDRRQLQDRRF